MYPVLQEGCVLALLSSGSVWEAVQQLAVQHYHQRAALLLHAAVHMHALPLQVRAATCSTLTD